MKQLPVIRLPYDDLNNLLKHDKLKESPCSVPSKFMNASYDGYTFVGYPEMIFVAWDDDIVRQMFFIQKNGGPVHWIEKEET